MKQELSAHAVLSIAIGKQSAGLPWFRHTRLRVTEFLTGTPLYSIRSSLEIPEEKIILALEQINPDWRIAEGRPSADKAKQLRALCEKFSQDIVSQIGKPTDYNTILEIEAASHSLLEVMS